ncbi:TetR/AcrR family transcriptional regulator [Catalinimonas sp. 4WD22]|uniref:TetR/AcrR family transcriptional regulator n=1 Tax=Catalinimonas locisalis TaxID=3133978 RepID=UPI003101A806
MTEDFNTEDKILYAAEEIFHQKGFSGARMQEIADRAEINKGLLHYYFKTKDKLFEAVFSKAFDLMVNRLNTILTTQQSLDNKIDLMVDAYMGMLIKHPHLPLFVINELNRHPDEFINRVLTNKRRPNIQAFLEAIQYEIDQGNIKPFHPKQVIMNIIGLCLFPFLARPMIQVLLDVDNSEFQKLIKERKVLVADFVKSALRP